MTNPEKSSKESQDFLQMLLSINETLTQIEIIKANLTDVKKRLEKTYWQMIE